jgi:peptide/nickel transport system permease protein
VNAVQRFEYIIKRLFFAIIVLINISIITFFISRVLPSDPAAAWVGSHPTQEQIAKATVYLGLDKPIYTQYLIYIRSILQGDLGTSIKTHQPILSELRTYLPATLELVIASTIIAIIMLILMSLIIFILELTMVQLFFILCMIKISVKFGRIWTRKMLIGF